MKKKQQHRVEATLCNTQDLRLQASINLPLTGFNGVLRSAGKVFAAGAVLCASLVSLPAFASAVYSQPLSLKFPDPMLSQADTGFSDGSAWVNNKFIATQSGTISDISWQGDAQPIGNTGFTITLIPTVDASGNPYVPVLPELAKVASLMTVTVTTGNAGQSWNKGALYNFDAVLTTPFQLVKDTGYWINIESIGTNPWAWAKGTGGSSSIEYCLQLYQCNPGISDRAFSLNGTLVTAVPVPAAAWLLGSGLMGLWSFSRSKNKTANG